MAKYVYPAIFTPEENGAFSITFPDLEGCYTCGDNLKVSGEEFINYISCDTMIYRKRFNNRAVKKTLTIPEWMNEEAVALGLNFSQILQDALLQKMHI